MTSAAYARSTIAETFGPRRTPPWPAKRLDPTRVMVLWHNSCMAAFPFAFKCALACCCKQAFSGPQAWRGILEHLQPQEHQQRQQQWQQHLTQQRAQSGQGHEASSISTRSMLGMMYDNLSKQMAERVGRLHAHHARVPMVLWQTYKRRPPPGSARVGRQTKGLPFMGVEGGGAQAESVVVLC